MAAISSARAAGHGDKHLADQAAVTSMREQLAAISWITAVVKIGEGERDEAPMLFIGEKIGSGSLQIDIAVDPLENTNATSKLGPNALCVLAAAPSGGLIAASDGYMNKLIVGPKVAGKISIRNTVEKNIAIIAKALRREVDDLTITILDRKPRNEDLIDRVIKTGARAQVIPDGDLFPGVLSCISGASTHALMGIGASPEGVISAAAVKLLGGEMQAVFWPKDDDDKIRLTKMGIDLNKVYFHNDLALGNELIFCVTAVTQLGSATKSILDGVSFFGGAAITNSLVITAGVMQKINTIHILDPKEFVRSKSEYRLF
ncbi:hypothetical protein A2V49_00740 [candidate division WWE3 bacterium RBG_19FT_COMBO_34_6]|uniref:Fructose-1,6-bisphosphatase n=1 Tax=candidate division WWE3 bacterium RBG_19FT_COMBO_34_6 TaxID=1802612 RepID=A0A1F4UK70_UNCKA|nr:MAG: hypothetical protein A2V49_00740 [candidate division WWE3 bacterium RBG_19FT_COMBO_34_6]